MNCYSCGKTLTELDYRRGDTCPGCRRDTRACKNCQHYSPGLNNDCKEPSADRVVEKEKSNFCDYFLAGAPTALGKSPTDLKSAADALFKKKS
ncbi:MAG: hypothetical protein KA715_03970 [Xanthomonadaceae bacterium]|nr:hypothetical protein [Xanthomonadaceae bacterium]